MRTVRAFLPRCLPLVALVALAALLVTPPDRIDPEPTMTPPDTPAGVDPGWWQQVSADLAAREYQPGEVDGALQAPNRAHGLRTWFRAEGLQLEPRDPAAPAFTWQWRTAAWGRSRLQDLAPAEPQLDVARVTYAHDGLTEWYENGPDGLEQGFTVPGRPAGQGDLRIVGRVSGDLTGVQHHREAIDYLDDRGALVMRYAKLQVWDADNQPVPAEMVLAGADIELRVDDRQARYPLTIDPIMTAPSWTGEPNYPNCLFGHCVATAGDVNGDGYSDVIVGAPHSDGGLFYVGRVTLYLGGPGGLSTSHDWYREPNQQNAFYGWSVATAGDVNADGYDDIVIGCSKWNGDYYDVGKAEVHHGGPAGFDWNPEWEFIGTEYNQHVGLSVSTAGDVNGDGYDDVIVAAPLHEENFLQDGKVMVFHGSPTGLGETPNWVHYGERQHDHFGNSVSWAGDVNADGYDDIIIGTNPETWTTDDPGYASVFLGSASGLSSTRVWSVYDDGVDSWFAYCVAGAGDVNGDGYSDVLVGAPYYANGTGTGRVLVFHGNADGVDAAPARTFDCDQIGALYGVSVATAGDVNGDGYADIIIGAEDYDHGQTDEGFAWIHLGYYTGVQEEAVWFKDSDQAEAMYGCSVATAGDVNGDGFSDVLVGAEMYDHGSENEGLAWCYLGGSDGVRDQAGWVVESNQADAESGYTVANLGDLNADGYDDAAVAAPEFDNGQTNEGVVFVFLGTHGGLAWLPSWWAEGNQAECGFGYAVAGAGDVNGDGLGDLIVGAHSYAGQGAAFVWHSSTSGQPAGTPANAHWAYLSGQASCFFGESVASAGDVNGDGYGDVIVGAPLYDAGTVNEGGAFVFHGSASGLSDTADWFHDTAKANCRYGASVASAGDMNGDGYSDVIVGAPYYAHPDDEEGLAFVYLGSADGVEPGAPWWYGQGGEGDCNYGASVASAGDVNGDGFSDIIIGAPKTNTPSTYGGAVYVYLGAATAPPDGTPGNAHWLAQRAQDYAWFGTVVDGAGDVNGDGFDDVVVSMPYNNNASGGVDQGAVALYLGSASGLTTGAADWLHEGDQIGGWFGRGLAGGGDYNGDGFADVLVGAPNHDAGQEDEGRAFVFYGNDSRGLGPSPRQWQPDLSTPLAALGRSTSETSVGLSARLRSPYGREYVRLECEVKPHGTAFNGVGTSFNIWAPSDPPSGTAGSFVHGTELVEGLSPGTMYKWRLRVHRDSPFFPRSRWYAASWNGMQEADVRTDGAVSAVGDETPLAIGPLLGYPNPFNPRTTFHFALPARERVRLAVHDARGRLVRTLVDGMMEAGRQEVLWDGRDDGGRGVASGVYLARVRSASLAATTKVSLVR